MSDVQFLRSGVCKYRWTWKCRTTCFKCNAKLGVPEARPPVPAGVWAKPKPKVGASRAWTEATSWRNGKRNKPNNEDIEQAKSPTDAARLLELLRASLPSLADCAELSALADKIEVERKAVKIAMPQC